MAYFTPVIQLVKISSAGPSLWLNTPKRGWQTVFQQVFHLWLLHYGWKINYRIFLSRRENQLTFERPLSWLSTPPHYLPPVCIMKSSSFVLPHSFIFYVTKNTHTYIYHCLHRSFCTYGCGDACWLLYLLKSTWHELSKCFSLDKNSTLCQWNFILLYFKEGNFFRPSSCLCASKWGYINAIVDKKQ